MFENTYKSGEEVGLWLLTRRKRRVERQAVVAKCVASRPRGKAGLPSAQNRYRFAPQLRSSYGKLPQRLGGVQRESVRQSLARKP